jgi:hypothetical protein
MVGECMRKIYLFLALFITFNISNVSAITFYDKILNDNGGKDTILNNGTPDFSKSEPEYVNGSENALSSEVKTFCDNGKINSDYLSLFYSDKYSFDKNTGLFSLTTNVNSTDFYYFKSVLIGKYMLVPSDWNYSTIRYTNLESVAKVVSYDTTSKCVGYQEITANREYLEVDNSKVYVTLDDDGNSFYYRGDINNNWVKFGKYQNDYYLSIFRGDITYTNTCVEDAATTCVKLHSKNDDMYWRVVRINGDGSIRLLLDGYIDVLSETVFSGGLYSAINENFPPFNEYFQKYYFSKWYNAELRNYDEYLMNGKFCEINNISQREESKYYYSSYDRYQNSTPTLKCQDDVDYYKVNTLSVDEAMMGGLFSTVSENNYLTADYNYVLLPPFANRKDASSQYFLFLYRINKKIGNIMADENTEISSKKNDGLRPVINLKAGIFVTGSGTYDDPYIPTLEDTKEETSNVTEENQNVIEENPKTGNTIISLVILMILTPIIILILKKNTKKSLK